MSNTLSEAGAILYATEGFEIVFAPSFDTTNEDDGPYQVRNKTTGVIELALRQYPAALETLWRFQEACNKLEDEIRKLGAKITPISGNSKWAKKTTDLN